MTNREKIIGILTTKHGLHEVASNSRKYRVFQADDPNRKYFVGKNGAVRVGRTVGESVSVTHHFQ